MHYAGVVQSRYQWTLAWCCVTTGYSYIVCIYMNWLQMLSIRYNYLSVNGWRNWPNHWFSLTLSAWVVYPAARPSWLAKTSIIRSHSHLSTAKTGVHVISYLNEKTLVLLLDNTRYGADIYVYCCMYVCITASSWFTYFTLINVCRHYCFVVLSVIIITNNNVAECIIEHGIDGLYLF